MLKGVFKKDGFSTHVHGEIAHHHNYTNTKCATIRGKSLVEHAGLDPMVAFENALFMLPQHLHDMSALQEELQMYG